MLPLRLARWIAPLVLVLGVAAPAQAKPPSPANCEVPHVLLLVGRGGDGTVDPIGDFRIVVRNLANSPEVGVQVTVGFSDFPEDRICTDQSPFAGADCPSQAVISTGVTAADGSVHVRVVGYADHTMPPATTTGQLRVWADGVLINWGTRVAALDQDGNGVKASDLSAWFDDFFHSPGAMRADLDGDGTVTAKDLSIWLAAFFAAGSIQGGGPSTCPL